LHTGVYARAANVQVAIDELETIKNAVMAARKLGLKVNAGHGLNYLNVSPVAYIDGMEELNIGHAIVSRAALVGMDSAVREMVALI
jgi:pyridoxine 5-phosphate synthase